MGYSLVASHRRRQYVGTAGTPLAVKHNRPTIQINPHKLVTGGTTQRGATMTPSHLPQPRPLDPPPRTPSCLVAPSATAHSVFRP
jgi:hypothetical protein